SLDNFDIFVINGNGGQDAQLRESLLDPGGKIQGRVQLGTEAVLPDKGKNRDRLIVAGHVHPAVASIEVRRPVSGFGMRDRGELIWGLDVDFRRVLVFGVRLGGTLADE